MHEDKLVEEQEDVQYMHHQEAQIKAQMAAVS